MKKSEKQRSGNSLLRFQVRKSCIFTKKWLTRHHTHGMSRSIKLVVLILKIFPQKMVELLKFLRKIASLFIVTSLHISFSSPLISDCFLSLILLFRLDPDTWHLALLDCVGFPSSIYAASVQQMRHAIAILKRKRKYHKKSK